MAGRVVQLELSADRMTWVSMNRPDTAQLKVSKEQYSAD